VRDVQTTESWRIVELHETDGFPDVLNVTRPSSGITITAPGICMSRMAPTTRLSPLATSVVIV
jgi:hypothetical protein